MKKTRLVLFIFAITIPVAAVFLSAFADINRPLHQWNTAEGPGRFFDSRQFAWAAESYYQGYDPLIENPANPRGQKLNYPRIWHLLFPLVVDESSTNIMGTIVVLIFVIGAGIFWFSNKFDNLTYYFLSIIFLSPAVMLGIERSNIELILFFILVLALTINNYSKLLSLALFVFASILKVYPVFGFVYLLKEEKRRFWTLFLIASGIFVIYALLSLNDFSQVFKTTAKGVSSSYGINVWWWSIGHRRYFNLPVNENLALIFQALSYVLALIIVAVTLFLGMRQRGNRFNKQGRYIDSFRVGASIYAGCFLVMNTVDYRLIFMVFTVPQLVAWARDEDKSISFVPRITLTLMVFSLWSNFVMRFLGRKLTFVIEEPANWVMLACFLYLLFSSLPDWFKDYFRRPFSFLKSSGRQSIAG